MALRNGASFVELLIVTALFEGIVWAVDPDRISFTEALHAIPHSTTPRPIQRRGPLALALTAPSADFATTPTRSPALREPSVVDRKLSKFNLKRATDHG